MKHLKKYEAFDLGRFSEEDENDWMDDTDKNNVEGVESDMEDELNQEMEDEKEEEESEEEAMRRRVFGSEIVEKAKTEKEDKSDEDKYLTKGQKKLPQKLKDSIIKKAKAKSKK